MKETDVTGLRFGRLVGLKRDGSKGGNAVWLFKCDCGREHLAQTRHVKNGATKSCGCLREAPAYVLKDRIVHGDAARGAITRLYMVWQSMKGRCTNPNNNHYRWYGALGITVCEDWGQYSSFRTWAAHSGYLPGLTIDRIDPTQGYHPANCRWVTRSENTNRARQWGTVTTPRPRRKRPNATRDHLGRFS